MTKMSSIITGVLFLMASNIAWAGSESGLYLGGSVGSSDIEGSYSDGGETIKFSDDDSSYKIFGGYNLGLIPLIDLAVEGSYVKFGSDDASISGLNAFALAGFKVGPIGLFAKVGTIAWDNDSNALSSALDSSGTDAAYGIGARFQIASVAIRAEYEIYDIDFVEVKMTSVGASWTF